MKKLLLFACFGVYMILQSGCKKQKEQELQNDLGKQPDKVEEIIIEGVVAKEGRLAFESLDFYESLFANEDESSLNNLIRSSNEATNYVSAHRFSSDPSAKSRYASMRLSGTDETLVDTEEVDSEFLNSILNPDGLVQIGQWVMRLDFNLEMVFALPESMLDDEGYAALFSGDSTKCATYSMDEEVIYGLMEYEAENPEPIDGNLSAKVSFWKWVCREGSTSIKGVKTVASRDQTQFIQNGKGYSVKVVRGYRKAGIWFHVYAKNTIYGKTNVGIWQVYPQGQVEMTAPSYNYKIRCGKSVSESNFIASDCLSASDDQYFKNRGRGGVCKIRFYHGPSALTSLYISKFFYRYKVHASDDWGTNCGTIGEYK